MDSSEFVNVRWCGGGRVHLQIGFVTVCLDPAQVKEVASATRAAVERLEGHGAVTQGWKGFAQ